MTFEAFIKRTSDGKEVDFEHNFEREPVTQIARSLHNQFSQTSKYYALLANVDLPSRGKGNTRQLDAILLSEDGMAVIDFKSANVPFIPTFDNRPWLYKNGKTVKAGTSNNPFRQVMEQRKALYRFMQRLPDYVEKLQINKRFRQHAGRNLKSKKVNKNFYHFDIQGRIVLTGERFDIEPVKREHYQQWFDIIWQDDCASFTRSMTFNKGVKLSPETIRIMIEKMFGLSPWIELESLYQKPFGFLTGESLALPVPLLNSTVKLGRNYSIAVRIAMEKTQVSREHAMITQTPEGSLLQDSGSRNGTWINGKRLERESSQLLKHGDVITLGKMKSGKASEQSMQFRYVTRLEQSPHFDLPELEETMGMTAINDVIFDENLLDHS